MVVQIFMLEKMPVHKQIDCYFSSAWEFFTHMERFWFSSMGDDEDTLHSHDVKSLLAVENMTT